jgi:hypothetical protein
MTFLEVALTFEEEKLSKFDYPISKTILLTGAGFTHNFGGFLPNDLTRLA